MDVSAARFLNRSAAAIVLLAACGGSGVEPDDPEANVLVWVAADFTTTEDAVLVNGEPRIRFSGQPRGYVTQHSIDYTNGGPFEPANDQRFDEAWYMDVGRRIVTRESGDTTFSHYVDLGDVALGGVAARQITIDTVRTVDVAEGDVRVYDNFILNRILFYSIRYKTDGSLVTFADEPVYRDILGGHPATLVGTGSAEAAPFSADLTLTPSARVAAMWNGEPVSFETGSMPLIDAGRPLIIDFTRPLDADRTVIHMVYLEPPPQDFELQRRASAVFELLGRTDRVVIPPSALTAIKSEVPDAEAPFLLRIYEHIYRDDVIQLEHPPGEPAESLSGRQTNVITLYVRMR